jgi:hypothetical protein
VVGAEIQKKLNTEAKPEETVSSKTEIDALLPSDTVPLPAGAAKPTALSKHDSGRLGELRYLHAKLATAEGDARGRPEHLFVEVGLTFGNGCGSHGDPARRSGRADRTVFDPEVVEP